MACGVPERTVAVTMQNNKASKGKRILTMVLSLLIGIGIWIYVDNVQGYQVYSRSYELPIDYVGQDTTLADRGLMLLDDSDTAITLKFEGTRKLIAQLDPNKIRIQVDLSAVTSTGTQSLKYNIVYPSTKFSKGINVASASAFTASVDVGELYSKNVEIRCDITGKVADGYQAGKIQYLPETLEVRGQESDVDKISYAKVSLDIDNATESVSKLLDYQFYDADGNLIEDTANIHPVASQIQVTLPVNMVKEIPLKMDFIEAPGASLSNVEYTISPATITVSGDAALMKSLSSIVLDDFNLADLSSNTKYNYSIKVPDGCQNLSGVTRATLKIAFKDINSTVLTATNFQCVNVPDGRTVTVLTTELPVTIRGTAEDVAAVTPDDLTVVADLQDVSSASGTYTVSADVQVATGGNIGVIGTYQITVTISDSET